ncbi:MAG: alpha/beta hydrolase [Gammaproteobacteria bacterium]
MLETVIVEPKSKPTHSVIWLHGLGADGHDFEPIVPELQPKSDAAIRFIFPHAPVRTVTLFGGMPARAWFDLFIQQGEYGFIESEVTAMAGQIQTIIDTQIQQDILPQNILPAGFSQGGAMAIYTALTSKTMLGGLIGLSTFLPDVTQIVTHASHRLPTLIAHGTADDVVPFSAGVELANSLKQAGFPVTWHSYPIGHGVSPEEVNDIKAWLTKVVNS